MTRVAWRVVRGAQPVARVAWCVMRGGWQVVELTHVVDDYGDAQWLLGRDLKWGVRLVAVE